VFLCRVSCVPRSVRLHFLYGSHPPTNQPTNQPTDRPIKRGWKKKRPHHASPHQPNPQQPTPWTWCGGECRPLAWSVWGHRWKGRCTETAEEEEEEQQQQQQEQHHEQRGQQEEEKEQ
jgi:hypothetical protein